MMDHRSDTLFSMGVPVSTSRWWARTRLAAMAFWVERFLMCWASSSTAQENSRATYCSMSRRSSA